tara:strand:+ start:131 stop:553 length:423 start_codon:yes stop_codon:yes gene_type:complete
MVKKSRIVKIIKEEINKLLKEQSGFDDAFAELDDEMEKYAQPRSARARKAAPAPKPTAKKPVDKKPAPKSTKDPFSDLNAPMDSAFDEMDRAQQVLKIISPKTPRSSIQMTGKGQNMKLNGVQVPPKYIPYILKGGSLPK